MDICDLADYILYYSKKRLSNLELQNYIYYLQVSHFKEYDTNLVNDSFELWTLGVINRDIYYKYRHYGASDIDKPKSIIQIDENLKSFLLNKIEEGDKYDYYDFKKNVIEEYRKLQNLNL